MTLTIHDVFEINCV